MSAVCPLCGGSIDLVPGSNPGKSGATPDSTPAQISGSNPAQSAQIEQEILGSKVYNQGYEEQFLTFWSSYPLHRGKRKAQFAWRKSVQRLGAILGSIEEAQSILVAGAIRYRDDPNRIDQFTKYAEGWLNGDGWEDDPLPSRIDNGHRETKTDRLSRMAAEMREDDARWTT